MRLRTVTAGLMLAVSLSSGCGFKAKEPKVEPPSSQQKALQSKLLSDVKKDTSAADLLSLPAPAKK